MLCLAYWAGKCVSGLLVNSLQTMETETMTTRQYFRTLEMVQANKTVSRRTLFFLFNFHCSFFCGHFVCILWCDCHVICIFASCLWSGKGSFTNYFVAIFKCVYICNLVVLWIAYWLSEKCLDALTTVSIKFMLMEILLPLHIIVQLTLEL